MSEFDVNDNTIEANCNETDENKPLITNNKNNNHKKSSVSYNACPTCKGSGKISKGI